jgi:6-phospho-beta-glucosidase
MKITIIGGAGLRTPILIKAILARQDRLDIHELALMDIDEERLEIIGALTSPLEKSLDTKFRIFRTIDPVTALKDADFVITTFRVGGIESRAIDERVPLNHGVLGQETTGAGGFAMGIRSIPVILDYVKLMKSYCPNAWLINFANPAGLLTEAVIRQTGWSRIVGICDGPSSMHLVIASLLGAKPEEIYLDYFGLNHLGWIKRILFQERDYLPEILELIKSSESIPGLPFDPQLVINLGMIPNEYLYYYYYSTQSVNNILKAGESRGEQIGRLNRKLLLELKEKYNVHYLTGMQTAYQTYLDKRSDSYMVTETGRSHDLSSLTPSTIETISHEGYAGVALDLIEGLIGIKPIVQILNVPNGGAITGMHELDVVEIPTLVMKDQIHPIAVGDVPVHSLGLMKQVKSYEQLTIEAAVNNSYQKAHLALTIHPLVQDFKIAGLILDEYISRHQGYFPELS